MRVTKVLRRVKATTRGRGGGVAVARAQGQSPDPSPSSRAREQKQGGDDAEDSSYLRERERERRIEERFRSKGRGYEANGFGGGVEEEEEAQGSGLLYFEERKSEGNGASAPLDLLPEPEETRESYSRHYKLRSSPGPSSSGGAYASMPDEPVYVSRRGGRGKGGRGSGGGSRNVGVISVASVGGLVCALSLLSYSGQQSSYRTIDSQQISMSTLQSEVEKGTDKLFGHCRHEEADRNKLVSIQGAYRVELLRPSAARAWEEMRGDARRDGISLHLVSGFRSVKHQEDLYFGVKAERAQSSKERARVSAPPGFSEHHTGYALDICDETLTLDESFASTRAYRWLQRNARAYNFELSFPESGEVAFEPWHWRFEGETEAIEQFYGRN
ncbi:D-alanyl-D-alanine carboxypeptidase [Chloropicon primus]|uniref:D-alanyl-D-alanine carboxypeptidase n=3 Tax=Chloropicon primus TaxID=1764295 RepID=A0A5B8MHD3_9CHLO|nr:D-alanyl-D-alanine carboxypeptidase [Chloropicon primus]|eukprot:QDZ18772.1 D-alanyl-D-alanine carboxypeptidase [Chloropicon primus]